MKKTRGCLQKAKFMISLILITAVCISAWPLACLAEGEADTNQIMVSLGDSYSSGEGIPPFYGQDDQRQEKVNNPDWLAHRSQKAWSGMLSLPSVSGKMSDHKDDNWFFVAASGAETKYLLNEFHKDAKKGLLPADSTDPELSLEPQLNVFDRIGKNKADYVTLTLGGNDADFVGIITKCILRGSNKEISNYLSPGELSDQLNNTWEYFFEKGGIRDNLYKAYHDIADRAGSQAQIIVAGYPQLLNPEGGFMISSDEADLVDNNVTKFNKAIESVVNQCRDEGLQINFVSVEEAFSGHEAYSKDSYINEVMYYLDDEDLTDFAMPPVSAFSIHPNEKGARAYAKCVQQKIDELESIANGELNNEFTVSVFDVNDKLYNNYLIKIDGEEYTGLLKWGFLRKSYSRTIEVDTAEEVNISLPKGNYTVTIVNGFDESNQYYRNIKVRPGSKNDNLEFRTIFGKYEEKPTQEGAGDHEDQKIVQDYESVSFYSQVIEELESEYGELRIARYEGGNEANGLCYLNLIDFNNDGVRELLAVTKHEKDPEYTVMVYTEENGQAVQLLSSTKLTDADWTGDYLCLLSDKNNHTYIDRRQMGSEWNYDEIYGYEKGKFKLISNSCRAYNFEKGEWDNYIVEEIPNVVDPMKLNRKLISKDEYEKEAPLATGASNTETNYICLAIPDTDIESGNYYGFDFEALQDSIDKVKRELVGFENGTVDNNESWRQSYIDYIETDPDIAFNPEWCTCGLIYVDNDEIPELIVEYSCEADGTGIVSFKNGETTSYRFSRSGGISYYEREGTIRNSIGSMGLMRDQFASLDRDGFHDLGRGQRYDESGAYSNYTYFNWNGEEISEEEYYANIDWFDDGRAKEWNTYSEEYQNNNYRPYEMCEYLSNN